MAAGKQKNPRRVAPRIRRSIAVQRARVRAALIVSALLLAVVLAGFWIASIPVPLRIMAAVLSAVSLFAAYADHRLRRAKEEHLRALEREIEGRDLRDGLG